MEKDPTFESHDDIGRPHIDYDVIEIPATTVTVSGPGFRVDYSVGRGTALAAKKAAMAREQAAQQAARLDS